MLSALVSSSLEHVPSRLACHSLAEAVHLASLSLFGLVSPFHILLLLSSLARKNISFRMIIKNFPSFVKRLLGVSDGQNQI